MRIAFFGSSLVSAYWNGAATYYRGIVRALAQRGHRITFYEPDAYDRQAHRDMDDPPWARVVVYSADGEDAVRAALDEAREADLVVKASGVGVFDDLLEHSVAHLRAPRRLVAFWDVDAPATLARVQGDPDDPFRELIPRYDLVLTYGGGPPVVRAYEALGARICAPIYNAHDSDTHHPVCPDPRFEGDLGFLGNRMPDREARVDRFFFEAARALPDRHFVLGGNGWGDAPLPDNVRWVGHVYTRDHNAFNRSVGAALNISRESMASNGYSPATRVFEAAAAGACQITDAWEGIDRFFEPGREILVARDGEEVAEILRRLDPERRRAVGEAARQRALSEHTYEHRAVEVERVLGVAINARAPKVTPSHRKPSVVPRDRLRIVIAGLSISSSWGNGHATTYRGLVRELARQGHEVLFLERDVPWYADNRDAPEPPGCRLQLYRSVAELVREHQAAVRDADAVIVGSYVPDGVEIGEWVTRIARGVTAFYDIDTPVTLGKLERGEHEYVSPDLIPRYDLYLSFTGGPVLERLEVQWGARCARALYCSVDPERYGPVPVEPMWDLGYIGTYSEDRQPTLERLLIEPAWRMPERRFSVAGPSYPEGLTWPHNVDRTVHVSPREHARFYAGQRFTLNVTRAAMVRAGWSPSVRLFEAAACGVPIISDRWPGLEDVLEPGREVLIAESTEDVMRLVREMPEGERRHVAAQARAKVLHAHTAGHRARQLVGLLDEARRSSARRRSRPTVREKPPADAGAAGR